MALGSQQELELAGPHYICQDVAALRADFGLTANTSLPLGNKKTHRRSAFFLLPYPSFLFILPQDKKATLFHAALVISDQKIAKKE